MAETASEAAATAGSEGGEGAAGAAEVSSAPPAAGAPAAGVLPLAVAGAAIGFAYVAPCCDAQVGLGAGQGLPAGLAGGLGLLAAVVHQAGPKAAVADLEWLPWTLLALQMLHSFEEHHLNRMMAGGTDLAYRLCHFVSLVWLSFVWLWASSDSGPREGAWAGGLGAGGGQHSFEEHHLHRMLAGGTDLVDQGLVGALHGNATAAPGTWLEEVPDAESARTALCLASILALWGGTALAAALGGPPASACAHALALANAGNHVLLAAKTTAYHPGLGSAVAVLLWCLLALGRMARSHLDAVELLSAGAWAVGATGALALAVERFAAGELEVGAFRAALAKLALGPTVLGILVPGLAFLVGLCKPPPQDKEGMQAAFAAAKKEA